MASQSDLVRVGRQLRALRRRRSWRQIDVAMRAGVSQGTVSLVERGHGDRLSVATLGEIAATLDARMTVALSWRAGDLDRLTDQRHADTGGEVASQLRAWGWVVHAEVTFSIAGERGSIDLLAWHPQTRTLLVIEIKTELTSVEATLRSHDAKLRLARTIAGRYGWRPAIVARLFVLEGTSTNRRRAPLLAGLAGPTMTTDAWVIRRWLRAPVGGLDGLWVRSSTNPRRGRSKTGGFHRVRAARAGPDPSPASVAGGHRRPSPGESRVAGVSTTSPIRD